MQVRTRLAVALTLLALAPCSGEEDGDTQVAVQNGGTTSIDAALGDGDSELHFEGVAAGTTSTYQPAIFGSLHGLTVSVGNVTSTIDLTQGTSNIVAIGADGKVAAVSVPVSSGTEGGGGW